MDMQNLELKIRLRNTIHFLQYVMVLLIVNYWAKGRGEPIEKD
jgi:hypothetical protein